jgi:hypothetical protein
MCPIAINVSSHQEHTEVDISGTHVDFASVTKQLTDLSTGMFPLKHLPNRYYPVPLSRLSIELLPHSNGVITALTEGAEFRLSGDAQAFQKLTVFLESLSNLPVGEHFHLDWFGNEDLLAPATADMAFVFSIEA